MGTHTENTQATFERQLRLHTVMPAFEGGIPYVNTEGLVGWMEQEDDADPWKRTNTEHLLLACYKMNKWDFPPISDWRLHMPDERCVVTFCVLFDMRLGHLIHAVRDLKISDKDLPLDLQALMTKFQRLDARRGCTFAKRFYDAQCKYFPVMFRLDMNMTIPKGHILPICRMEEIGRGGHGRVSQILVQNQYVSDEVKARLSKDEHTRVNDQVFGPCFQLALKTFEHDKRHYFNNEKRAFAALSSNKGMIQCLACFDSRSDHVDTLSGDTKQYHILLEYGRFDLMEVFQIRLPPVGSDEIQCFWGSLVEILDALQGIHNFTTNDGAYHGWHNDIKPENIIVVDDRYKLADPGFAKFQRRRMEDELETLPKTVIQGGTIRYGAPELHARAQNSRTEVDQTVDLWSIGCIFSEAATWVVLGYQGLCQFQEVRRRAIQDIARCQSSSRSQLRISEGDFFHDGKGLLRAVKVWHKFLHATTRRTDHVTSAILEFTEAHLLIGARKASAGELYGRLKRLLEECAMNAEPAAPDPELTSLVNTLLDMDKEAESQGAMATVARHTPGCLSKLDRLTNINRPFKTVSRSDSSSGLSSRNEQSRTPAAPQLTPQVRADESVNLLSRQQSLATHRESPFRTFMNIIPMIPSLLHGRHQKVEVDIDIVVDNKECMLPHWRDAKAFVEDFVKETKHTNEEEVDLFFSLYLTKFDSPPALMQLDKDAYFSKPVLEHQRSAALFRKKMRKPPPAHGGATGDIISSLEYVFNGFIARLERRREEISQSAIDDRPRHESLPKPLTIVILTTGLGHYEIHGEWQFNWLLGYINRLHERLKKQEWLGKEAEKLVRICFVQFGCDDHGPFSLSALRQQVPSGVIYHDILPEGLFRRRDPERRDSESPKPERRDLGRDELSTVFERFYDYAPGAMDPRHEPPGEDCHACQYYPCHGAKDPRHICTRTCICFELMNRDHF